jgi:hypothetical protein
VMCGCARRTRAGIGDAVSLPRRFRVIRQGVRRCRGFSRRKQTGSRRTSSGIEPESRLRGTPTHGQTRVPAILLWCEEIPSSLPRNWIGEKNARGVVGFVFSEVSPRSLPQNWPPEKSDPGFAPIGAVGFEPTGFRRNPSLTSGEGVRLKQTRKVCGEKWQGNCRRAASLLYH